MPCLLIVFVHLYLHSIWIHLSLHHYTNNITVLITSIKSCKFICPYCLFINCVHFIVIVHGISGIHWNSRPHLKTLSKAKRYLVPDQIKTKTLSKAKRYLVPDSEADRQITLGLRVGSAFKSLNPMY